jgi:O-acetyl-ADP-ribose deacetylase (regulator of RNase III)
VYSIAFPNISTGVYRFPKEEAANIAIKAVNEFISHDASVESIVFVCFDDENYSIYKKLLPVGESS